MVSLSNNSVARIAYGRDGIAFDETGDRVVAPESGDTVRLPARPGRIDVGFARDETTAGPRELLEANCFHSDDVDKSEAACSDQFLEAEVISVQGDRVQIWLQVSPHFRVKISVEKQSLRDIHMIPGVCFQWSSDRREGRPTPPDVQLDAEIERLERELQ